MKMRLEGWNRKIECTTRWLAMTSVSAKPSYIYCSSDHQFRSKTAVLSCSPIIPLHTLCVVKEAYKKNWTRGYSQKFNENVYRWWKCHRVIGEYAGKSS
jgi:hypothetical protein